MNGETTESPSSQMSGVAKRPKGPLETSLEHLEAVVTKLEGVRNALRGKLEPVMYTPPEKEALISQDQPSLGDSDIVKLVVSSVRRLKQIEDSMHNMVDRIEL